MERLGPCFTLYCQGLAWSLKQGRLLMKVLCNEGIKLLLPSCYFLHKGQCTKQTCHIAREGQPLPRGWALLGGARSTHSVCMCVYKERRQNHWLQAKVPAAQGEGRVIPKTSPRASQLPARPWAANTGCSPRHDLHYPLTPTHKHTHSPHPVPRASHS